MNIQSHQPSSSLYARGRSTRLELWDKFLIKTAVLRTRHAKEVGPWQALGKVGFYPRYPSLSPLSASDTVGDEPTADARNNYSHSRTRDGVIPGRSVEQLAVLPVAAGI